MVEAAPDLLEKSLFERSKEFHRSNTEHYCFLDLETTGLDPFRADWITAAFIVTDINHLVIKKNIFTARPDRSSCWDEGAEKIHKIPRDVADSYPARVDALHSVLAFLSPYSSTSTRLVFHANGGFDWNFLRCSFYKYDLAYDLYRHLNYKNLESTIDLSKRLKHEKNSLDYLCGKYGISLKHHDAESDVSACMELHKIFTRKLGDQLFS